MYAELHCLSNFSFQRGASSARELFERARVLGYAALAITDECSLAGIVRAFEASRETGVPLIVGSEFALAEGPRCVLLVRDQAGYSLLCALITQARRRAAKGRYQARRADWERLLQPARAAGTLADSLYALWLPEFEAAEARAQGSEPAPDVIRGPRAQQEPARRITGVQSDHLASETQPGLHWLQHWFGPSLRIAVELHRGPDDPHRLRELPRLGRELGIALVACGDARMHVRGRRALLDVLTATALNRPLSDCGFALQRNGERHLRRIEDLQTLYSPEWLDQSLRLAEGCQFRLDQLRYEYPHELVPEGNTASGWLRELTEAGLQRRWPQGTPATVLAQVEHELALIGELQYEHYFLTVEDIVRHARGLGILCQGRGSAANSAVCYALGITEVDPARGTLLFERFISRERNEPPDIDVDFEHERREEVIQYIYRKYGRERAALAATVICYRAKSAIRDVGKALGLPLAQVDQITRSLAWWDGLSAIGERLAERGLDGDAPVLRQLLQLVQELVGFPRHLSQHVGGFVISHHPLHTLVPVENAAMPERTIIQWDKDDLESLRLLKVDCLALGMLSAIRRCLALVNQGCGGSGAVGSGPAKGPGPRAQGPGLASSGVDGEECSVAANGRSTPLASSRDALAGPWAPGSRPGQALSPGPCSPLTLATIPPEDPATYDMICAADTVGVFQIESRAQMSMLPRLQPRNFYDLVIEVAIVRPGPIQGRMVHPYLRRRQGLEQVDYPSEALREVFERTLGVPIFQEQVMQLAIVAAGFSPGEADQLRRSMAAWKRHGGLEHFRCRIIEGMAERGYTSEFAEQVFEQIKGFGSYGFPESHAASFALLVYASAWLKCHHPAAFCAALINSQPMGFYSPDQLIQDARRHGVSVRPVDVRYSGWDCGLEGRGGAPGKGTGPRAQGPVEAGHQEAAGNAPEPAHMDRSSPSTPELATPGPWALSPGPYAPTAQPSLRLGLRLVRGLTQAGAERLVAARTQAAFASVQDLAERAQLARDDLQALAAAGALKALAGHRHRARWAVAGLESRRPLLDGVSTPEEVVALPLPSLAAEARADYAALGLTLGIHPLALLRPRLRAAGWRRSSEILALPHDRGGRAAGLVTLRQRPGTAAGVTFLTIEDESGWLNVVVWKDLAERQRRVLLESRLLGIEGRHECAEGVHHLIAERLHDLSALLDGLDARSRDFH